ncbi:hypothetical protein OJF2_74510 [Aquisphaera giovannonii]|uniref:VapC45 PIN like domain-containing protein n=1 Tax=Aquisphaera giovannonii TaxID=406548 RepID=A0A5B9WFS6_9BACT|nr:hypothetical protein [Aquisphaera giovannonii]QEH38841.1 hypothetical protein OJF2_74510 [Aquisphaera giovannonii]
MDRRTTIDLHGGEAPRDLRVHSASDAARYLGIPEATIRSWVLGRKPYGARAEGLLESTTFLADHGLGKRLGESLRSHGLTVESHLGEDADDLDWPSQAGTRGWVVLTKDKANSRGRPEIRAIESARVRMFTLASGHRTGEEMAQLFVENLWNMGRFLKDHPAPFIARISRQGIILVYPRAKPGA